MRPLVPSQSSQDFVLCGHPKQCQRNGDEPIYWSEEYAGVNENKLKEASRVPLGAWSAKKLVGMGLAVRDSCECVVILRKVHRYHDFDDSVLFEKRALSADEVEKFLQVLSDR